MSDILSHLETRRTELLEQQRLRELEAEVQLLETDACQVEPDPWLLWEEWGQRLSQQELTSDLGWGESTRELDDVNARAGGAERPIIESELQLAGIRARARRICQEIPACDRCAAQSDQLRHWHELVIRRDAAGSGSGAS